MLQRAKINVFVTVAKIFYRYVRVIMQISTYIVIKIDSILISGKVIKITELSRSILSSILFRIPTDIILIIMCVL